MEGKVVLWCVQVFCNPGLIFDPRISQTTPSPYKANGGGCSNCHQLQPCKNSARRLICALRITLAMHPGHVNTRPSTQASQIFCQEVLLGGAGSLCVVNEADWKRQDSGHTRCFNQRPAALQPSTAAAI